MCTGSAFCCARTDWDFCVVNFQRVTVGAAQGSTYILGQICTLIYHRQHNAVNIQPGIDTALYLVDGFEQGHQTFEGEMLRLHRNNTLSAATSDATVMMPSEGIQSIKQ